MARNRILIGLAVLAALCVGSGLNPPYPTLEEVLDDPEAFAGERLVTIPSSRVVSIDAEGFVIEGEGEWQLRAVTEIEDGLAVGDPLMISGVFDPPGELHDVRYRVPRDRPLKIAISIIPLMFLPMMYALAIRYDRRGRAFHLRRRTDAGSRSLITMPDRDA